MSEQKEKLLETHRARLNAANAIPMTVEEVLSGEVQGGVPRPTCLTEDEDDGSVERVGLAAELKP